MAEIVRKKTTTMTTIAITIKKYHFTAFKKFTYYNNIRRIEWITKNDFFARFTPDL